MILIIYCIIIIQIINVELKVLDHLSCEKVSSELALQGFSFEDDFQLTQGRN